MLAYYNETLGIKMENNVHVAKMSTSTYLSKWTDSRSEIGSVKMISEYDQEIPQSQTADNHVAPRGSYTTITIHQEDKQSKATCSLFPIKMIAKLEWTQSNAQKHRTIIELHNVSNNQQQ